MKKTVLSVLLLISVFSYLFSSEFASFLFSEEDYYRCITELKREFYEGSPDTVNIFNNIGVCYFRMDDYKNAALYFSRAGALSQEALNNYLITQFRTGAFEEIAAMELEGEKALRIKMLSEMMLGKYDKEKMVPEDSIASGIFNEYYSIGRKNPVLAGLMSVIPGAGRLYCSRADDALFSMTTVILPALVGAYYYWIGNKTGLYVSAAVTALFYAGDIYGAVNSARIYFPSRLKVFHEKIIDSYSDSAFKLEYNL